MSISFNNPLDTMTSTGANGSLELIVLGGTPTNPRPIRFNSSSVIIPVQTLPTGEQGAMVFDRSELVLKYHNGTSWVAVYDTDTILEPIRISLDEVNRKLNLKVESVTYSSSTVPSASISGTTLNIVFPTASSGGSGPTGLYTSLKPGAITQYSLTSGQTVASIREQMSGVTNGQSGRNGSQGSPWKTSDGWCFADGMWWQWEGENGTITKQVPNLNQEAYLKGITTSGVTKTDSVIASSASISGTAISIAQLPPHSFSFSGTTGAAGRHGHSQALRGMDRSGLNALTSSNDNGIPTVINNINEAPDHVHSFSGSTNTVGSGQAHTHGISNIDVPHFNVAYLYNIAESNVALSEKVANTRYVLKTGDVMTGSLTIANSASIRSNDTSLVLYFRNATNGERAAIYHNSSNNTLRLRSNGGSEVTINSSGVLYAPSVTGASLSISGNTATVASKNIVRSINGNNADVNGNVTLTLGAVQDVRLSKRTTTRHVPDSSWNYVPEGATLDGLFISVNGSSGTHVEGLSWRYTQKLVNGVWTNVVVES
ncbi:hypothetical protein BvCmsB5655_03281 [Escherichia coli]|uniref:hypothetical protein n=1 Tax=Escherichia coli TaxID=562 RepID=UPI0010AF91AD|nr:hypothetical protein [Escherichia coli]GCJ80144.1 hypothetical protein BvCmsB5655_03281 [Escherichia coli]